MQLKLIIKHSLFRRIHTHCLLLRICIHADKTWCRHTWRFSPLFSTSIYHPDIPLWRASKGWILPHDRSLYKFALPNQMVSVKLWQQWAGFRAKYLLKSVLHLVISANMSGAPNLVSQDMAFVLTQRWTIGRIWHLNWSESIMLACVQWRSIHHTRPQPDCFDQSWFQDYPSKLFKGNNEDLTDWREPRQTVDWTILTIWSLRFLYLWWLLLLSNVLCFLLFSAMVEKNIDYC